MFYVMRVEMSLRMTTSPHIEYTYTLRHGHLKILILAAIGHGGGHSILVLGGDVEESICWFAFIEKAPGRLRR